MIYRTTMKSLINTLLIIYLMGVLSSCSDNDNNDDEVLCLLKEMVIPDEDFLETIDYDDQNRPVSIVGSGWQTTIHWENDVVIKMEDHEIGNSSEGRGMYIYDWQDDQVIVDQIRYGNPVRRFTGVQNSDGHIVEFYQSYYNIDNESWYNPYRTSVITWDRNNIKRQVTNNSETSNSFSQLIFPKPDIKYSNERLTSTPGFTESGSQTVFEYEYDDQKNPFRASRISEVFNFEIGYEQAGFFHSTNNQTKITHKNSHESIIHFEYEYNEYGYPTQVTERYGEDSYTWFYTYNCQ